MQYFIRLEKFLGILALISETILKINQRSLFPAQELASTLGKLHSLHKSHGSIVSIMTHHLQHLVGKQVFSEGWAARIFLGDHCRRELLFLQEHLISFNGKLIPASKTGAKVISYEEISKLVQRVCYSEDLISNLVISDTSFTTVFMFFKDKFIQTKDFKFDAEERDLSSGHRELLATLTFLEDCKQNKVKFSSPIVYWQTDSQKNLFFCCEDPLNPFWTGYRNNQDPGARIRDHDTSGLDSSFSFQDCDGKSRK